MTASLAVVPYQVAFLLHLITTGALVPCLSGHVERVIDHEWGLNVLLEFAGKVGCRLWWCTILTLLPWDGGMSTRSGTSWRVCARARHHISISFTVSSPCSPHPAAELLGLGSVGISFLGDTWSLENSTPGPPQHKENLPIRRCYRVYENSANNRWERRLGQGYYVEETVLFWTEKISSHLSEIWNLLKQKKKKKTACSWQEIRFLFFFRAALIPAEVLVPEHPEAGKAAWPHGEVQGSHGPGCCWWCPGLQKGSLGKLHLWEEDPRGTGVSGRTGGAETGPW